MEDFSQYADVILSLKRNRLFKEALDSDLAVLCKNGSYLNFQTGDFIITEGDREQSAYVVLEGEIRISRDDFMMARFGPGTLFGEFSMMTGAAYSASAQALTDVYVFQIPAGNFQKTVQQSPSFSAAVIRNLALRLRRHL